MKNKNIEGINELLNIIEVLQSRVELLEMDNARLEMKLRYCNEVLEELQLNDKNLK